MSFSERKRRRRFRKSARRTTNQISIDVLEPIRPEQYGQDDAEALALRVRQALVAELGEPADEAPSTEPAAAPI